MGVRIKFNPQGMRDLEQRLKADVQVPLSGSESSAMAEVKRQYQQKTGASLNDVAARDIVRKARK